MSMFDLIEFKICLSAFLLM